MRVAAALATVAFLTFANTLGHGFVWDDFIWLEQRLRFHQSPLDTFFEPVDVPGFPGTYRPLTFTSYWLDQRIWWRNPLGFHLTSVSLHALNSVLVYALVRLLGCARRAAYFGALLFAVHPVHVESVAWVTSRVDVLATVFVLTAVLLALRLRRSGVREDARGSARDNTPVQGPSASVRARATRTLGPPELAALGGIALASFAAASSKEVGLVVPLLILLLPSAFAGDGAAPLASTGARMRRRRTSLAVAAAFAGVLAHLALRPAGRSPGLSATALEPGTLLHLLGAFGFYIERALAPFRSSARSPSIRAIIRAIPSSRACSIKRGTSRERWHTTGRSWRSHRTAMPVVTLLRRSVSSRRGSARTRVESPARVGRDRDAGTLQGARRGPGPRYGARRLQ